MRRASVELGSKVALVTGAGYGIGRGIARRLAEAGACVVVNDVNDEHGRETVGIIESAGGTAAFIHADVTIDDEVRRTIAFAEKTFGGLDILVNNAGSYYDPPFFPQARPADWQRVLEIFLRAYMTSTQMAIEAMRRRGGGAIVNISSGAGVGFGADNEWPDYAAAKATVMRLTATLAPLKQSTNVRVNCICPGWVATENVRAYLATWSDERKQQQDVPAGGPDAMLQPADIGYAVVHFVREEALSGRIMLYYEPGKRRLIPADLDLFSLGEEV
jgi:NAD(P)-dependent dehydrogenase (short-subunit alcohol dehydrogenase family)